MQANSEAAQIYEQTKDRDVNLRESETIIRDLATKLSAAPPTPPPSLAELFTQERQKLGLEPLESRLAQLDSEIESLDVNTLVSTDRATNRHAPTFAIAGEQQEITRKAQQQRALLSVERSSLARQVDNKFSALQMTMQFTQQDFANASQAYNQEFSRNMQMLDLFTGLQDREDRKEDRTEAKQDRLADNARANLQTVTNLIKDSGKTFADMDEDQLRNVQQWEIQAGYPSGTFEAFGTAKPEAKILHTSSGTNAAGQQIVTFIYDDGTGKPGTMEVVKTGGVAASARDGGSTGTATPYDQWHKQYLKKPQGQALAKKFAGDNIGLSKELHRIYDGSQQSKGSAFTATEKKKLEQAGLLNAPRQQQLDHLYKNSDPLDAIIEQQIQAMSGASR